MIGRTISHYRILDQLGAGGMGVVFKAEDVRLMRPVAMKFLPESVAATPDALERFRREAQAASALNHPNICTIAYMSPEQARGEAVDARTDLFSFGAILYEMATGHRAFGGETPAVIFSEILGRTPVACTRLNPDLPREIDRIVDKALEKDPQLRYQTAADIRADLRRVRRGAESGQTPVRESLPSTLAVLPFRDLAGAPDGDAWGIGMADAI